MIYIFELSNNGAPMYELATNDIKPIAAEATTQKLEGLSGITIDVSARVAALVEVMIEELAANPKLKDVTSDLVAEAILKGLSGHGLSKENLITFLELSKN
jgi:hypothetical protein